MQKNRLLNLGARTVDVKTFFYFLRKFQLKNFINIFNKLIEIKPKLIFWHESTYS